VTAVLGITVRRVRQARWDEAKVVRYHVNFLQGWAGPNTEGLGGGTIAPTRSFRRTLPWGYDGQFGFLGERGRYARAQVGC